MDVLGYKKCLIPGCEGLVLNEVAYATGGRCSKCWSEASEERVALISALIEGRTAQIRLKTSDRARNRRREARRARKPEHQQHRAAVLKAKVAAKRRLTALHRAEYLYLLADERQKRGLDPWPAVLALELRKLLEAAGSTPEDVIATLEARATYDPGDAEAEDVEEADPARAGDEPF